MASQTTLTQLKPQQQDGEGGPLNNRNGFSFE